MKCQMIHRIIVQLLLHLKAHTQSRLTMSGCGKTSSEEENTITSLVICTSLHYSDWSFTILGTFVLHLSLMVGYLIDGKEQRR